MIFKSPIMSTGSGSMAGITFSHNKGGMYMRARTIPTNPATTYQQAVRGYLSQLTNLWLSTLTAAQRAAWDAYAAQVPVINRLGDQIHITGLAMYVRSNVVILQAGMTRVDDGPVILNLGEYTNPSFALDEPNDECDLTFDNTDDWANEDDAAMLLWCSRAVDPTINYFKGPYRYAGKVDGDSVTPPTSPAAIGLPFPVASGQRIFCKISVVRADGRLAPPFRGYADA